MSCWTSRKASCRGLLLGVALAPLFATAALGQANEPPPAPSENVAAAPAAPIVAPAAPIAEPAPQGPMAAPPPAEATPPPAAEPAPAEEEDTPWYKSVVVSGYVEAYYARNFANPENKTIANRWLDERANSFTLQTLALDVAGEIGPFSAKVTLMFGPTADRWYFEGADLPVGKNDIYLPSSAYSNETWKHVQTAYAGYKLPVGKGLLLQAGLFPTQVGYEGAAVKDNFNFSRSNIFNFLPFFHVGARAVYPVTEKLTLTAAVYNGWNQITDQNNKKTMSLHASYLSGDWLFNLLYIGGAERPKGVGTGLPWRNLFDGVLQYTGVEGLTLAASAVAGFENNHFGMDYWYGGALHAQYKFTKWLYLAVRGDGLKEGGAGADDAPIFFGPGHVLSGTATLELRPIGNGFSLRLEYRHDDSSRKNPLYYAKGLTEDGAQKLAHYQNTLTIGATGWF